MTEEETKAQTLGMQFTKVCRAHQQEKQGHTLEAGIGWRCTYILAQQQNSCVTSGNFYHTSEPISILQRELPTVSTSRLLGQGMFKWNQIIFVIVLDTWWSVLNKCQLTIPSPQVFVPNPRLFHYSIVSFCIKAISNLEQIRQVICNTSFQRKM